MRPQLFKGCPMSQIIENLADISSDYDALFVDLWGCVHNGITHYPDAVAALQTYRKTGGKVVLVTNSPRPHGEVELQITNDFGVPRDAWDAIATSGDSARAAMFQGAVGRNVFIMGTSEDNQEAFLAPMAILDNPEPIKSVPLAEADGIVCLGPFDRHADPEVNRADFLFAREKGMKLLCANPDIIVDVGHSREWCAGALAAMYTEMGGESLYFGKPHPPIYDLARRRLFALGVDVPDHRILAIGDGIGTDVRGGQGENIDCLFITGGLAARDTKTVAQPDADALAAYLATEMQSPLFSIGFLR